MQISEKKTQETDSRTAASMLFQGQSGSEPACQLVDNRMVTVAQLKLQEMVNNSHQVKKMAQLQAMVNHNTNQSKQAEAKGENFTNVAIGEIPVIQRMKDHTNQNVINSLVSLNNLLLTFKINPITPLSLSDFTFLNTQIAQAVQADAAINGSKFKVYDAQSITGQQIIQEIDNEIASNFPPPKPQYKFNDSSTWDTPLQFNDQVLPSGFLSNEVTLTLSLKQGSQTNNSGGGGAVVGVNYHNHVEGGNKGIAFRYVKKSGPNEVWVEIYDYANKRQSNDYEWTIAKTTLNKAP